MLPSIPLCKFEWSIRPNFHTYIRFRIQFFKIENLRYIATNIIQKYFFAIGFFFFSFFFSFHFFFLFFMTSPYLQGAQTAQVANSSTLYLSLSLCCLSLLPFFNLRSLESKHVCYLVLDG